MRMVHRPDGSFSFQEAGQPDQSDPGDHIKVIATAIIDYVYTNVFIVNRVFGGIAEILFDLPETEISALQCSVS